METVLLSVLWTKITSLMWGQIVMEKNNFLLRTTDKDKTYNYCYDIDGDGEGWIKEKCYECSLGKFDDISYEIVCKAKELCEYG